MQNGKTEEQNFRKKILIVDDDEDCALTLKHVLRSNYDIDHFFGAEEALKNIDSVKYNIILMDIGMKGLNGIKALKKIREKTEYKDIPAIALTAYAMNGDRERFLEEGFNFYVSKPFSTLKVKELIDEILG